MWLLFLGSLLVGSAGLIRLFLRLGPRRFAIALASFAAVIAAFVGLAKLTGCADDDRPELVDETVGGHRRLRHPTFDFTFAYPGSRYLANDKLGRDLEPTSGATCDGFASDAASFAVCAVDDRVASRDAFVRDVHALRRGMARAIEPPGGLAAASFGALTAALDAPPGARGTATLEALAANQPTTITDDLGWADGRGTAYLHLVSHGIHLRMKAFTVERGLAVMIVVSTNGDALGDVVASFAPLR